MKTVGIITEYNPFHEGHHYQLNYARESLGADYIIAAISGDYVQRGTPALLPKQVRTEMALRGGADLVLELPVAVSTASAEYFASGGVSLLERLGITDILCFGSEWGDIRPIMEIAKLLYQEPESYKKHLQAGLQQGLSFPKARSEALFALLSHSPHPADHLREMLASPNNILGVEYCRAILSQNCSMKPVTLKRLGNGYHEEQLQDGRFPSASAIRKAVSENRFSPAEHDRGSYADLLQTAVNSNAYILNSDFDALYHYRLMGETAESLSEYFDISKDLANRIIRQRNSFRSFEDFCRELNTREITQTRIQRGLLHMLLNIKAAPECIPYARVLGFRRDSAPLLKHIKQKGRIPLLTKLADAQNILHSFYQTPEEAPLAAQGISLIEKATEASNIYEGVLCRKTGRPFLHEFQKEVVIV